MDSVHKQVAVEYILVYGGTEWRKFIWRAAHFVLVTSYDQDCLGIKTLFIVPTDAHYYTNHRVLKTI
jgi:hypothetical protein